MARPRRSEPLLLPLLSWEDVCRSGRDRCRLSRLCLAGFGLEVAGRQGDPEVQVFCGGVGDLNRHLCHGRLLSCTLSCPLILRRSEELVVYRINFTATRCQTVSLGFSVNRDNPSLLLDVCCFFSRVLKTLVFRNNHMVFLRLSLTQGSD